jgi:acyl-CoA thioesterase
MSVSEEDRLARRIAEHMLAKEGTGNAWGLVIEDGAAGYSRLRMTIRQDMTNAHGTAHGGMIFALADTAFAYACNSRNQATVAQSASIVFTSPVQNGERLEAEAREIASDGPQRRLFHHGQRGRRPRRRAISRTIPHGRRGHSRGVTRMAEAYHLRRRIRTAVGRYSGSPVANVRPDDLLAKVPLAANPKVRNPQVDRCGIDDIIMGCANQAGEDNRNVARMAALLAGLSDGVPGDDHQPAVRIGHGRGRHGGARDQARRGRSHDRRRRGEHDARAVRDGKGRDRLLARPQIFDTTIGWRFVNPRLMKAQFGIDSMPETAENVADDFQISARSIRTGSPSAASERASAAQARAAASPRKSSPSPSSRRRAIRSWSTRTNIRARPAWSARQAEADRARWRHHHGRQRQRRQRRRGGAHRRQRKGGVKRYNLNPIARVIRRRGGGRAAAHHGHRPGAGHPEGSRALGIAIRRSRCDRAQRSLRGPGPRGAAPARPRRRRRACEPERRRHRARPSARACRGRGSPSPPASK